MRLTHLDHMSKSEWVATHIGLGLVVAGGLMIDLVPQSGWLAASMIGAAILAAAVSIHVARSFPRNTGLDSVALKAEVNRNEPIQV